MKISSLGVGSKNLSQSVINSPKLNCQFCAFLSGEGKDKFESRWLNSQIYSAVASIGPLVPGWSLICPIRHSVNLCGHYSRAEFWTFTGNAVEAVQREYGECVLFEHGPRCEDSLTGCGTGHAHLHLVPLQFSLERAAKEFDTQLEWIRVAAKEIDYFAGGQEYLFVADRFDGELTSGMLCVLKSPTSQFFRRVIAKELRLENSYDYKQYPMLDSATLEANRLRASTIQPTSPA